MIDIETATKVVNMIETELCNKGYAYTSFDAMCREYDITEEDFNEFLSVALNTIEKSKEY